MTIKVAIQGERGSFSEQAAGKLLGASLDLVCCGSFADLFSAMKLGKARVAVVPIENTLAGSLHRNYDLLLESGLEITAETNLRIEHCLIGTRNARLQQIRTVLSHPVALEQCRKFLKRRRSIAPHETYDTAGAVQQIVHDANPQVAAIAGLAAAKHFHGKVLARNIEDNRENFTRFFALERPGSRRARSARRLSAEKLKTSIVFITKNVPGALFRCLSVFALRDINLSKIESRPLHGKPWQYLFYVDLLAGTGEERTQNALRHLLEITEFLRVLGCYPAV
ncbi:MAG: prephenate dehydratase [Acidobacteria bacterium]|nr:prephenate dehydratase [Acidobacteriota bacterium]